MIYKLEKAEKMLSKYSGCYSGEYFSAEEYYNDFKIALNELKNGDNSKPDLFYRRFASSYHWDDYVGTEGIKLGNDISSRCS
ncbi:MAG: hypothetical protein K9G47_05870 [Bacteroidales bacterium]|nr:hypothetical protein [Bacteroidales bacterium]